nr:hypothetical protein [Nitratireductor kimnyeongensis]
MLRRLLRLREAHVPGILEHGLGQLEQVLGRLQPLQKALEGAFQFLALDRLAIALAALGRAEIIRVFLILALRPAGRQRLLAIIAEDETAQREVRIDVLARRSLGRALEARLYLLEGLEADKPFVLALAERDTPAGGFDVSGIHHARQHIGDALIADFAIRQIFRERRLTLQEALHFDLRLEAPGGIAFQRFLQDGGIRLIAHEDFAVPAFALIAIADRSLMHPIAVLHARPHAVDRLLAVLLALVLGNRGEKVLDELRIGIFAEFDRGADKDATGIADLHPQLKMRHQPARKAANVVDYDRVRFLAVL